MNAPRFLLEFAKEGIQLQEVDGSFRVEFGLSTRTVGLAEHGRPWSHWTVYATAGTTR